MNSYVSTNITDTKFIKYFLKIKASNNFNINFWVYSALYTPINEKHPLQPQSPYSASKISSTT